MYSFLFKSRLERLNPRLFVDDSSRKHVAGEWYSSALCEKPRREDVTNAAGLRMLGNEQRQYLEALESGNMPHFICGVPTGWVPEYDVFDKDGKVLARGWRGILTFLARRKLISLERAREVFQCTNLGLTTYDHSTFEEKAASREVTGAF